MDDVIINQLDDNIIYDKLVRYSSDIGAHNWIRVNIREHMMMELVLKI